MKRLVPGLALAALLLAMGCHVQQPSWLDPGTIPQQQRRAVLHDPYGDPSLGPDVTETRPREYQAPIPETVKSQMYQPRRGF